ncbi:hypothetical protein O5D80_000359 [Batrachochytrium dendrobatidis]|nr:hypothetical protein O5D80_000359 [Batrachochytrium dendrobatidis]
MNTTMKPINIDLNQYFQLMSLIYKDLFSLLHSSSNSNHYSLIRIADPQCLASLIVQIVQTILRRQPTTAVLVIAQSPDTFRQIPVPSMDELNPFTCSNPANSNSQTLEPIQVIMEHHVYIRYDTERIYSILVGNNLLIKCMTILDTHQHRLSLCPFLHLCQIGIQSCKISQPNNLHIYLLLLLVWIRYARDQRD